MDGGDKLNITENGLILEFEKRKKWRAPRVDGTQKALSIE